jgi:peptidoglycan/xylan/chitin deacetylase (PgdA/CDA1 family)
MIADTFGVGFSRLLIVISLVGAAMSAPGGGSKTAHAADSAVVVMYHRFGESDFPSTNIRLDQFEAHIRELTNGPFTVLAVPEILRKLRNGESLPDRTVGITVDDAFLSVYTEAWPRLRAAGLPMTLFVSTDDVDRNSSAYMTWDQVRELKAAGVTIGNHTGSHLHMPQATTAENADELARSNARFRAELGEAPTIFAYPFGEYGLQMRKLVTQHGFTAAFGQQSGVVHKDADQLFLPRFSMNEAYGGVARFRLAVNALPLRVRDVTPSDPLLTEANNPPFFGFTVFGDALADLDKLNCYASQGRARIDRLGRSRIEVRFPRAFPSGRAKINCTMPAADGRWRWYGMQFYVQSSR